MADSKQQNRDPLIAAPQVGVALQLTPRLQHSPSRVVALRPVFPKNAAPNLPAFRQFVQPPLHRDPNIAARSRRSISVDNLDQPYLSLPRNRDLAVETPQRFIHRRHIGLKIDSFDFGPRSNCKVAGLNAPGFVEADHKRDPSQDVRHKLLGRFGRIVNFLRPGSR